MTNPVTCNTTFTLPQAVLARMITACPSYKTWKGLSAGATDAEILASLSIRTYDARSISRPQCMIAQGGKRSFSRTSAMGLYQTSGSLLLSFERDVPAGLADGTGNESNEFENSISPIFGELLALSGVSDNLEISRVEMVVEAWRNEPEITEERGDFFFTQYEVTYTNT